MMTCYFNQKTGTIIGEIDQYEARIKREKEHLARFGQVYINPHDEKEFVTFEIHNGEIPEEIDGVEVVEIGERAFEYGAAYDKIVVPASIQRIGTRAFYHCISLQSLELSEGLEEIGYAAFEETGIKTVRFPDSLKVIGPKAFCRCNDLVQVSFGLGIEEIHEQAFSQVNIQSVVIPQKIKMINHSALARPTDIRRPLQVQYVGTKKEWEKLTIAKELRTEKVTCLGDLLHDFIANVSNPVSEEEKKLYEMGYNKEYLETELAETFSVYREKYKNEDMDERQVRCLVYRNLLEYVEKGYCG